MDHDGGVIEREGLADSVDKLAGGCICCQASLGDELEQKVGEVLRKPAHAEDRYDGEKTNKTIERRVNLFLPLNALFWVSPIWAPEKSKL